MRISGGFSRTGVARDFSPAIILALGLLVCLTGPASAQMPDPRQMSGIPLPAPELPDGTISVRVIRGQITNNIPDQPVELVAGGETRQGKTDASGRAQFAGIKPGVLVSASTTLDGARIESRQFAAPDQGGVRLMLVAAAPGADQPTGPTAAPGTVVLGSQSRFIVELAESALRVYLLLEVFNGASTPVETKGPLLIELPSGAQGAATLEGSSPQASVEGTRIIVRGPFQSGSTPVQVAYALPYTGSQLTIEQPLPVPLQDLALIVEKTAEMEVTSSQISENRIQAAGGKTYFVAGGPSIPAGSALTLELAGLPHHSSVPRNVALGLAILVLALGAWAASTKADGPGVDRDKLVRRRESLFTELVRLERAHRQGRVDAERYRNERRAAMRELERLYDALEPPAPPTSPRERPGPLVEKSA